MCTPIVIAPISVIKFPWVEVAISLEGKMTYVKCRICNEVEKRKKLLVPKFDGLQKHVGCQKRTFACSMATIGQYYISNINQHVKNEQ